MKTYFGKIFTVMLAMLVLGVFSACHRETPKNTGEENTENINTENNGENTENIENTENTENSENSENIDIPQKELHPDGVSRLEAREICFVTDSTALPQMLPVYIDEYAVNQTGPMYESTDELREELADNLADLLEELYGDGNFDISIGGVNSVPEASFKKDERTFSAVPNIISVYTTEMSLYRDTTSENICDNALVRAAMEYLDIDVPQIKMTVTNNLSGEVDMTVYTISEKTNSFSEHISNTSFEHITVQHIAGVSEALVSIYDVDDLKVYEQVKVMSVDEAIEAVSDKYPGIDKTKVKAELFYSNVAKYGYFTPCYRLYIEKKIDGYEKLYDIINVPFAYANPFYTSLDVTPKD